MKMFVDLPLDLHRFYHNRSFFNYSHLGRSFSTSPWTTVAQRTASSSPPTRFSNCRQKHLQTPPPPSHHPTPPNLSLCQQLQKTLYTLTDPALPPPHSFHSPIPRTNRNRVNGAQGTHLTGPAKCPLDLFARCLFVGSEAAGFLGSILFCSFLSLF